MNLPHPIHRTSEAKGLTCFAGRKIISIHMHTMSKTVILFEGGEELHIDAVIKKDDFEQYPGFEYEARVCFAIPVNPDR